MNFAKNEATKHTNFCDNRKKSEVEKFLFTFI